MTTYLKSIPSVISGISVTDAYQSALKIMGHDYANKYANYFAKKQKTIKSGKSSFRDSGRQKTYNAEFKTIREYKHADGIDEVKRRASQFKTLNWKETQRYFKKIAKSKMGIVFHTTYTGGTIEDLSASFGANISKLGNSSDVWIDDATYKDVSGKGSMTAKETLALTQELSKTGKAFHGIKRKDLTKFMEIQGEILRKGSGASYKTYWSMNGSKSDITVMEISG